MPVAVIGAGSWGTALGMVLARNGHRTLLWDSDREHVHTLTEQSCNNRHLPGHRFPELLLPQPDFDALLDATRDLVIAAPCDGLQDILTRINARSHADLKLCLACKGLEPTTHALGHQIVFDRLGEIPVAVLSGPSFAAEVAAGMPTAVAVVSEREDTARDFACCFHNERFRIYTHDDVIGVEVGGAVKNVMAIAAGIADGLGFGANTRAALITRGLAEITRLGVALGGRQETFMGLAGLGDLVLTCTDDQSRNRRLGLALAAGSTVDEARRTIGQAIEGLRTVTAVHGLAARHAIDMPISEQIYQVVSGAVTPRAAVQELLSREPKTEGC